MTKKQKKNEDRTEESLPEEKGICFVENAAKVKGEPWLHCTFLQLRRLILINK